MSRMTSGWWRGARGEWLVAGQFVLMGLVFVGPRHLSASSAWSAPFPRARAIAGGALVSIGCLLALLGAVRLGDGLTPLPYPKDDGRLVTSGAFRIVRHPMYSGLLLASIGVALLADGWLTWLYAGLMLALLDVKSRREERWLAEKFPDYPAYRRRVRKLVPFLY